MSEDKTNLFTKLTTQRAAKAESPDNTLPKRGRPATGKRSDPEWIGRTYYIRRETDLDVEEQLHRLKRNDQAVDKSELVDFLLSEWVKSRKDEKATFRLGENI